jgi:hypothetical protein
VIVHLPGEVDFGGGSNGGGGGGGGGGGTGGNSPTPSGGGYLEFVRLPYDVDTTVRKVEQIPELDNFLGTRLLDGR